MVLPKIIQGGMGVGVSGWRLARAVSALGQLGVVSGTALDQVFARRLQDGDPGGHCRRALSRFPFPLMALRIWDRFYIDGGKAPDQPYIRMPLHTKDNPAELQELCIAANFVEVFLAKEGHHNPVGINYLEKIQVPHLPSIYGALLAGVDAVLMGAGIPLRLPGTLDRLALHQETTYPLYVIGAGPDDDTLMSFDPRHFAESELPPLKRPLCLPIIASNTLAVTLVRKSNGRVDGFIVEGPTAGGHNAPPRGKMQLDANGEPVYGERDVVDLKKLRELGLPFWLAGGFGSSQKLADALAAGAAGIQVGTAFAFCQESGLLDEYKRTVLAAEPKLKTDPLASPTGFPFKVLQLPDTVADLSTYSARPRICDLGYLREAYRAPDGEIGYRCAGEPVTQYVAKGGKPEDANGRMCLCNGLMANIGHGQVRAAGRLHEPGLITAGDDIGHVSRFLKPGQSSYTAADVIQSLLGDA
jgi:nitronate monooxygenase